MGIDGLSWTPLALVGTSQGNEGVGPIVPNGGCPLSFPNHFVPGVFPVQPSAPSDGVHHT